MKNANTTTARKQDRNGIPVFRSYNRKGQAVLMTVPGPELHDVACVRDGVFGPDPDCARCVSLGAFVEEAQ
jgi:hypothetical protein